MQHISAFLLFVGRREPRVMLRKLRALATALLDRAGRVPGNLRVAWRGDVRMQLDDMALALTSAEGWQARAEAAELHIRDLEQQLASSEVTAMELRSRVVCLHGKLATSAATVRYQSMTLNLEKLQG